MLQNYLDRFGFIRRKRGSQSLFPQSRFFPHSLVLPRLDAHSISLSYHYLHRLFLGIRKESLSLFSTLSLKYLLLGIQLEYFGFLWDFWLNCRWVILHFNHSKVSPVGYPIRDYLEFLWDFLVNLPLDYREQLAASFLGVPKVLCVS